MPEPRGTAASRAPQRGGLALVAVAALVLLMRGLVLLFDHSLNSIDGALQTWFALSNFAHGEQLGTAFQSYLGITMVVALLPVYAALGQTLFASTMAANTLVVAGAFAAAYGTVWMCRGVPPRRRWQATLLLVFLFYSALRIAAETVGRPYPVSFDPGVSLRPLRGFLPFFVLPFFVLLLRRVRRDGRAAAGALLGLVAGAGLLWSNDAGIPLVIAAALGIVMALHGRAALMVKTLAAFGAGTAVSAAGILMLVTHGHPGPWLRYNFQDVAGDQFWFFAPWDRSTRILGVADLPNILSGGEPLATASLVLLTSAVLVAIVRRLRGRGSPIRGAAFIFVGAAVIGTALIPQIGGHIGPEYNGVTFVLGACAPLILSERVLFRLAKPVMRRADARLPGLVAGLAALAMVGIEAGRLAATWAKSDRVVYVAALGFHVTRAYAADLQAMRRLSDDWRTRPIRNDRKLLSVYTSPLDIVAGVESPAPVGSLIHALGPRNRADVAGLVAGRAVEAVTTIAPDYSGWEGWILRANWPFFRQLYQNYTPIARNNQQILWVRAGAAGGSAPPGPARCTVSATSPSALVVSITAPRGGLASVTVDRRPPFGTGRTALLTVTERSPDTIGQGTERWSDFPRYGVANAARLSLVAPVAAGVVTRLTLDVMDGSDIGAATCTAQLYAPVDTATLPGLPEGIDRYLAGARR